MSLVEVARKAEEARQQPSILDCVRKIVGNDTLMVFGPTGSGKTTFATILAHEAAGKGAKVIYLDTERNLAEPPKGGLYDYKYYPTLAELYAFVRAAPEASLMVIDSLSTPIMTAYASADTAERGAKLLKALELAGYLKLWTWRNKSLAVVTNQPVSRFGKDQSVKDEELPPRLGSCIYEFKEVWRSSIARRGEAETVCEIHAWRSRRFGFNKPLFRLYISDNRVRAEVLVAPATS